jgi:hypothetical protein
MLETMENLLDIGEKLEGCVLVRDGVVGTLLAGSAYLMPPDLMPHLAGDVIQPMVQERVVNVRS